MNNLIEPMVFDLKEIEEKAKYGDGLSCYILARSYDSQENGAEQNFEKAVYWYKRGAELKDPRCLYGLGACYFFGDGVCLIEWSCKIEELLPEQYTTICIEKDLQKGLDYRKITITG